MLTTTIIVSQQQPSLAIRIPESITIKSAPIITKHDFALIIPEKDEIENFKFTNTSYHEVNHDDISELKRRGYYNSYHFFIKNKNENLTISVSILISLDPSDIGLSYMLGSTSTANNPTERKTSFTGKPIGKYVWSYPTALLVEDYWILMKVQLVPQNKRNSDNSITFGTITDGDKAWAEEMGRKILDRATVLGLTSRPAESAPLWAKEQVAKRRAEQKRQ
jgi:hypothetical protein